MKIKPKKKSKFQKLKGGVRAQLAKMPEEDARELLNRAVETAKQMGFVEKPINRTHGGNAQEIRRFDNGVNKGRKKG